MSTSPTEYAETPAAEGPLRESWLLLVSFYAVIAAGVVPLAAVEMSSVYVLIAAFLCMTHALLVGPGGRPLLTDTACKLLSIGALLYGLVESMTFDVHISYSLGHFLVLVQLVLLYGPHRLRELRLIPIIALFELMVAGIWALDLIYLPAFMLSGAAVMANFMAVDMHSDAGGRRRGPAARATDRGVGARDFLAAAWLPILIVFLLTALLFPLLPRFQGLRFYRHRTWQMVTGFSENVSLRDVGLLRQSDRPAFTVQFFRQDLPDHPVTRPHLPLMRGTSLPLYRRGQWFGYAEAMLPNSTSTPFRSSLLTSSYFASENIYDLRNVDVPRRLILQKVKLDEEPGRTLFALYRPLRTNVGAPYELIRTPTSHDLINPARRLVDNSYQVISMVPKFSPQMLRKAGTPRPSPPWLAFWKVPGDLQPVLGKVQQEVDELYQPKTDYDRVVACVRYLMDPARFTYTLDLPDYGHGDPVAGFLTRTHRGSCEQFSSALALMLRMWQIPTRLVVGYKGGTYDPVNQNYLFRDRDAHAWVEVYFNHLGWVEFDPTPGSATSLLQAQGINPARTGLFLRLRQTADSPLYYAKMHWNLHVIGYSREQQRAFAHDVGKAAGALAQDATSVLRAIWPGLPDLGFMQVALLVVAVTFVGICLYLAGGWLERALARRRPPVRTVRFYEELLAILRRKGLRRPLHQTPREFARTAAARLAPQDADVESAVNLVTDLYYRARFGGYGLDAAEEARLSQALRLLRATPRPPRVPTPASVP